MNQAMQLPKNVNEPWSLYDTVILQTTGGGPAIANVPQGWFMNVNPLGGLGNATDVPFFNVRNRNVGVPYNNQDARDQMPYAMKIRSLGISFWYTHQTLDANHQPGSPYDDIIPHIFMVDLPRHCSVILKVQQDERFKSIVPLCPPGYGPCGHGYARGQPSIMVPGGPPLPELKDNSYSTVTQGVAENSTRWTFPTDIDVPRRASLSVTLRFSEFARNLLIAMGAPNADWFDPGDSMLNTNGGIQVTLNGDRLVQQRAEYHA
jgi:hypothetical protein